MSNSSVSSSTVTPLTPFKTHPPMREKMEAVIKQARQFPVMEKEEEKECASCSETTGVNSCLGKVCFNCRDDFCRDCRVMYDGNWWCKLCHSRCILKEEEEEEEESFEDWAKDTIVSGIVCRLCENELPPMTAKDHLDGKFNKTCPHNATPSPKCKWCGVVGKGACYQDGKGCVDTRATKGLLEYVDEGEKYIFPKCVICGGGRGALIQSVWCLCNSTEIQSQHRIMMMEK